MGEGSGSALTVTVNAKTGDQVGNIFTVKAEVLSDAGVSKVEFSVDDQLKLTLNKAPYEYKWDTVDEDEGQHTLIVSAYDSQGNTAVKRVRVEVENGLSQGIKPHAQKALEYFHAGQFQKAQLEGRKAYKINIADLDAIRALAAGIGGLGDYNRALDLLEKPQMQNNQVIGNPKDYPMTDPAAMELRGRFRIQRAEKQTTIPAMLADLSIAFDFWRKLHANYLTDLRKAYPDTDTSAKARFAIGDALFYHGEYEAAAEEYRKIPKDGREFVSAQNRLALALMRMGRYAEAEQTARPLVDRSVGNDGTRAVLAALQVQQRNYKRARTELEPAIAHGSLSGLIVGAYAEIGTGNARRAYDELRQAAARAEETPDIQYLAAGYFTEAGDLKTASSALFGALRLDPGLLDTYAMRGYQLATLVPKDGFAQAQALFDFVLSRDPQHVGARLGRAIALVQDKKYRQAEPILKQLTREERFAGEVWIALAAAHSGLNDQLASAEDLKQAKAVDPERFGDTLLPSMTNLMARVGRYRRPPLLTPLLLTLEETGASALPPMSELPAKP
jgi:tetratricopeptide (TPR) repeat protein